MGEKACCFIGRSCILSKKEFRPQICAVVESLIVESKVDTFIFTGANPFVRLCCDVVTQMKEKYPYIKKNFYLSKKRSTDRYCSMIDRSRFCVIYCNEENEPAARRSAAGFAKCYAAAKKKKLWVLC